MTPVTSASPSERIALVACRRCGGGFWREDDCWSCYQCGFTIWADTRPAIRILEAPRHYRTNIVQLVRDVLAAAGPRGVTVNYLATHLDVSQASVNNALSSLYEACLATRTSFVTKAGGGARWYATGSQAVAS